jgi:hypothetical protein
MYFMHRDGWYCQFLEADLKTPLPRKLTFEHPQKIIELAERGGYSMHLEERQSLDHGIENGSGARKINVSSGSASDSPIVCKSRS